MTLNKTKFVFAILHSSFHHGGEQQMTLLAGTTTPNRSKTVYSFQAAVTMSDEPKAAEGGAESITIRVRDQVSIGEAIADCCARRCCRRCCYCRMRCCLGYIHDCLTLLLPRWITTSCTNAADGGRNLFQD
jgi:hypothetical protein